MSTASEAEVRAALAKVIDPEVNQDIVSMGMVKDLKVKDGEVSFTLELTTPACPLRNHLERAAREAVESLAGVSEVKIEMGARTRPANPWAQQAPVSGVINIVAVGSGKGGVGKSAVAVNLAAALAEQGARVGLLDADIYGPNIPLMMGVTEAPLPSGDRMLPAESYGVKLMSIGFFQTEESPIIWRGPLVSRAIQQFIRDTDWGELDYLFVDLPPGTGDAQLTLVQTVPLAGVVIVATPQRVALDDAIKGLMMFQKVGVEVLGVVENMSYFVCPHCGERTDLFGHGGAREACERLGVPFLGEVPLDPALRIACDSGRPVVFDSSSSLSTVFKDLAASLAARISVVGVRAAMVAPRSA